MLREADSFNPHSAATLSAALGGPVVSDMSLEQMHEQKKASCPVCGVLNDYAALQFNDWTHCVQCKTPMVLVKIDNIVFFLRHGWT